VLRNKEYAEIVEECETKFVKEIEFEHFRENYSFEEAEEISQDLEKIRRWFAKIVDRDWFHAEGRADVVSWIDRCAALLADFEEVVYRRQGDDFSPDGRTGHPLPIAMPMELIQGVRQEDETMQVPIRREGTLQ